MDDVPPVNIRVAVTIGGAKVYANEWYRDAEHFQACVACYSDPTRFKAGFEAHRAAALRREARAALLGIRLVRVHIEPADFLAWCRQQKERPGKGARLSYAHELAQEVERRELDS